jgi:hypothetical protein
LPRSAAVRPVLNLWPYPHLPVLLRLPLLLHQRELAASLLTPRSPYPV